jgi:hypothetical protein
VARIACAWAATPSFDEVLFLAGDSAIAVRVAVPAERAARPLRTEREATAGPALRVALTPALDARHRRAAADAVASSRRI